jgi:acetyl esterase/lipase
MADSISARRFFVRTWPLLASLALLAATPFLLSFNRHGRVAVRAAVYLPDMVLQVPLPIRPIELITEAPSVERVTIEYESRNGPRSIEADVYRPGGGGEGRRAMVFSMGAPPLDLDNKRLVRVAEDSARAGVVMVVPFSERLDEERIEPEEIDALVEEFRYAQRLPGVDPARVGFFGASVGGSLALVAAGDPRIADEVDQVVSFGGYYDALDTFGAIATHHIEYDGIDEEWTPRRHAEKVMARQLIAAVDNVRDRELLTQWFIERKEREPELLVSAVGRSSYDFLANRDPDAVRELIDRLPEDAVARLDELSPRTSVDRVKAELFIIHDRADPFIPYTESRRLEDAIGGRPDTHFDEIRLFEHVEPKLDQRPDIVTIDTTRLMYRLYQMLLGWD